MLVVLPLFRLALLPHIPGAGVAQDDSQSRDVARRGVLGCRRNIRNPLTKILVALAGLFARLAWFMHGNSTRDLVIIERANTMIVDFIFRRLQPPPSQTPPPAWLKRFAPFLALLALVALPHVASAGTGLQGTGGGTPVGPTVFTFQPGNGPLNSGTTLGTPAPVITTNGGSVVFTSPQFSTGGNFVVKNASNVDLLQGNFASLNQYLLTSTSLFASLDVTYTGGMELTQAGFAPGDTGTLGLTLSGVMPGSGTGPQTANEYGLSFDVNKPAPAPVPEPSAAATFAVAGLGLGGLLIAAKRKKASSAL